MNSFARILFEQRTFLVADIRVGKTLKELMQIYGRDSKAIIAMGKGLMGDEYDQCMDKHRRGDVRKNKPLKDMQLK